MDLLHIIKTRRSIRQFRDKSIPQEIVEKLKEALIWAPSAGNLQSRKFYFVFDKETKKKLAEAALGQMFIARAPLVVVGCADRKIESRYGKRGSEIYMICDVAVSIQNLLLLAHGQSLGGVFIGAMDEIEVVEILKLPRNLRPIAIVPIGYPAETPEAPPRISKKEAVEFR